MPVPPDPDTCIFQGLILPDLTDSVECRRGGFWRRALAFFIDLVAISALLQMVALLLFPLTHGQVQFSGGPLHGLNCQKLASVPEGVSIPPEFNANSVTDCQQSLLGLPTIRTLRVSWITRDGVSDQCRAIQRLGADGKPTPGLPLDIFVLPLLIAVQLRARPYRGKYRPQDLPPWSVERIGRTISAANDIVEPALRGAGVAAGAGLDLSSTRHCFPARSHLGTTPYWLCWAGTGIPADRSPSRRGFGSSVAGDAFYDRFAGISACRASTGKRRRCDGRCSRRCRTSAVSASGPIRN